MHRVLVVDDSAVDRALAGGLLEQPDELDVSFAVDGREALDAVRSQAPDLIVSDLQMPQMNGLELVEAVRREFPGVPIVIMTARGSEEIAAEALRRGAASYVPKVSLGDHLRDTVHRVLIASRADRAHSRLMHSLEEVDCRFRLRNDPELIEPLVAHFQEVLRCLPLNDEAERLRAALAVKHALWIAHHHGNLEMPIDVRVSDKEFRERAAARRREPPFNGRGLVVSAHVTTADATFSIRHEGPGFQVALSLAEFDSDAVDHSWLSGFVFMPTVMDDVRYEDGGKEVRLTKRAVSCEIDFSEE